MYMPTLARFTSRDPLADTEEPVMGGLSAEIQAAIIQQYAYANNSPMNNMDPSGRESEGMCGPQPRKARTASECCAAALKDPDIAASIKKQTNDKAKVVGIAICCEQRKIACQVSANVPHMHPSVLALFTKCNLEHELYHATKHIKCNPEKDIERPSSIGNFFGNECDAFRAEAECYVKNAPTACPKNDKICEMQLIERMQERILSMDIHCTIYKKEMEVERLRKAIGEGKTGK